MKNLTDFIVEIPDLIPKDELTDILGWLQTAKWDDAIVGNDGIDKTKRNCMTTEVWGTKYDNMLFNYASMALGAYTRLVPHVSVSKDTGYALLRYEEGGFYVDHVDSSYKHQRLISLSITFNDDYEGGDFSFFEGEHVLKTKPGSALMFPSNFMYPHSVTPITRGTRYSMVTWFI